MAEIKFSQLTTAAQLTNDDIFALAQMQGGSLSSVKTSMIAVANFLNTQVQYTTAYSTQAKTTSGAINELKQLISLIPQFAIEVVEELPTEDISDTTIYLVPAEDPEVGNYYEEYIHVNDSWELVGTTAVDLSAYYTKLEVDGLLATKASVTEVALKENKSDMPTDVRTIIKDCKTPKSATITNGIAQFECIDENLVKGLKVTMNPIQDLHGYDYPWVGGAGKNKCPNLTPYSGHGLTITVSNYGEIVVNGTPDTSVPLYIDLPTLSSGDYTISANNNTTIAQSNTYIECLDANDTRIGITIYNSINAHFSVNGVPAKIKLNFDPRATFTDFILKIQLESGETATDYAPYSNICPISGRTEVSVTRTAGEDVETKTHQYTETIYGGTDDFVNGELSNEWVVAEYDGDVSEAWAKASSSLYDIFYMELAEEATGLVDDIRSNSTNISIYSFAQMAENAPCISIRTNLTPNRLHIAIPNVTTVEECKAYLAEHNLQVCYKKATPTTIQTSAEEITTVEGTNIISGTEPISECKYTELATVDDLIKIIGGQ